MGELLDKIHEIKNNPNFKGLPTRGKISASDINTELGRPATQKLSLNDPEVRELAGKSSGKIAYSDLYGQVMWSNNALTLGWYHTNRESSCGYFNSRGFLSPTRVSGGYTCTELYGYRNEHDYEKYYFHMLLEEGRGATGKMAITVEGFGTVTYPITSRNGEVGYFSNGNDKEIVNYFLSKNGATLNVKFRYYQ